jgi:hypothetical protein
MDTKVSDVTNGQVPKDANPMVKIAHIISRTATATQHLEIRILDLEKKVQELMYPAGSGALMRHPIPPLSTRTPNTTPNLSPESNRNPAMSPLARPLEPPPTSQKMPSLDAFECGGEDLFNKILKRRATLPK